MPSVNNVCTSRPGVTVIIPAYNYAQYLPATLDSVLAQTYEPIEILVIDDGSTDNTREVAAAYGERIRYIYQRNAGLSASRNAGVALASYDLLAFLDADDIWKPRMIEILVAKLQELPQETLIVACRHENVDECGVPITGKTYDRVLAGYLSAADILLKSRFMADSVVVKKRAFDLAGGFDTCLRSTEDRDMWLRISHYGMIHLVPEVLLQVRCHPGSMSTHALRMKTNGRVVLNRAYARGTVPKWQAWIWLRTLAVHYFQAAWMYHDEKRYLRASVEMLKSIVHWPFFFSPRQINEPVLFRIRAIRRFLWQGFTKPSLFKNQA